MNTKKKAWIIVYREKEYSDNEVIEINDHLNNLNDVKNNLKNYTSLILIRN